MDNYTYKVTTRDAKMHIITEGRITIKGESADEAKADLLAAWERNWPDENATDIEIVQVDTIQRPAVLLQS